MTRLEKIEREVASLSAEELDRFREWFAQHDAETFDARIARDTMSGRLDGLGDAALAQHRSGKTRPL